MTIYLLWVTLTAVALALVVGATAVLIPTLHTLRAALRAWRAINRYLNLTPWFWGLERKP